MGPGVFKEAGIAGPEAITGPEADIMGTEAGITGTEAGITGTEVITGEAGMAGSTEDLHLGAGIIALTTAAVTDPAAWGV